MNPIKVPNCRLTPEGTDEVAQSSDLGIWDFANTFPADSLFGDDSLKALSAEAEKRWIDFDNRRMPASLTLVRAVLFEAARTEILGDYCDTSWFARKDYMRLLARRVARIVCSGRIEDERLTAAKWLRSSPTEREQFWDETDDTDFGPALPQPEFWGARYAIDPEMMTIRRETDALLLEIADRAEDILKRARNAQI